jgi:hypothetical protein
LVLKHWNISIEFNVVPTLRTQDLNKWIAATFSGRTIAINDQHVTPVTAQDVSQYEPGAEWPSMGMCQVSKLPDWGGTSIYQFFFKYDFDGHRYGVFAHLQIFKK